ncbi:hypothetical protein B0H19DRAFT_1273598 [Mycena capillaripes]|nr:hypothetical protein B0H19DRAFT_1273598 [Mycena capillaripes]
MRGCGCVLPANAVPLCILSLIFLANCKSANAIDCPATDQHAHALTNTGQSADGSLVCTYPSGVCIYVSDGELTTEASTSPICPVLAIDNCAAADTHGHALTSGAPSADGSLVCTYPSGGELNGSASTSPICPNLAVHPAPPSHQPSSAPSSNPPSSVPPSSAPNSGPSFAPPESPQLHGTPPISSTSSQLAAQKFSTSSVLPISTLPSSTSPSSTPPPSPSGESIERSTSESVTDSENVSGSTAAPGESMVPNSSLNSHRRTACTTAIAGSLAAVASLLGFSFLLMWCRRRRRRMVDSRIATPFTDLESHKPWGDTILASSPMSREKQGRPVGAGADEGAFRQQSGSQSNSALLPSVSDATSADAVLNLRFRPAFSTERIPVDRSVTGLPPFFAFPRASPSAKLSACGPSARAFNIRATPAPRGVPHFTFSRSVLTTESWVATRLFARASPSMLPAPRNAAATCMPCASNPAFQFINDNVPALLFFLTRATRIFLTSNMRQSSTFPPPSSIYLSPVPYCASCPFGRRPHFPLPRHPMPDCAYTRISSRSTHTDSPCAGAAYFTVQGDDEGWFAGNHVQYVTVHFLPIPFPPCQLFLLLFFPIVPSPATEHFSRVSDAHLLRRSPHDTRAHPLTRVRLHAPRLSPSCLCADNAPPPNDDLSATLTLLPTCCARQYTAPVPARIPLIFLTNRFSTHRFAARAASAASRPTSTALLLLFNGRQRPRTVPIAAHHVHVGFSWPSVASSLTTHPTSSETSQPIRHRRNALCDITLPSLATAHPLHACPSVADAVLYLYPIPRPVFLSLSAVPTLLAAEPNLRHPSAAPRPVRRAHCPHRHAPPSVTLRSLEHRIDIRTPRRAVCDTWPARPTTPALRMPWRHLRCATPLSSTPYPRARQYDANRDLHHHSPICTPRTPSTVQQATSPFYTGACVPSAARRRRASPAHCPYAQLSLNPHALHTRRHAARLRLAPAAAPHLSRRSPPSAISTNPVLGRPCSKHAAITLAYPTTVTIRCSWNAFPVNAGEVTQPAQLLSRILLVLRRRLASLISHIICSHVKALQPPSIALPDPHITTIQQAAILQLIFFARKTSASSTTHMYQMQETLYALASHEHKASFHHKFHHPASSIAAPLPTIGPSASVSSDLILPPVQLL